ncbi:MAG: insulinase family protein [Chlorobi bacterium]|jgi:predicted Zn-dependent peptidase|nr:insulinase family protein [Chlorobiota bacterium]
MRTLVVICLFAVAVGAVSVAQPKKQQPKKSTEQAPLIPIPKEALNPPVVTPPVEYNPRKRPDIGQMREYEFPRYEEATLKNGLKIYVIEDHRQPTIGFRLEVRAGESFDGDKPGLSYLMANLLTKGTRKRSALDIATALDSIGAELSASTGGEVLTVTASGLKKHMPLLLAIFSDVVVNPTFPKEELDKLMPQVLAAIRQEKSRPMQLAMALSRMVLYGPDHPSAKRRTEESVRSITVEDIRAFHSTYVRPNNIASLAIVGDVTLKEIVPQIEAAFRRWEAGKIEIAPPPPPKPMPRGVYFVERPGSVQSTIVLCGLAPGRKDPDYEKLDLAVELLGNGFSGRLFKTLRETYSFTYTPYAFLTQGKYFNRFVAGADVRTPVTDSAILVLRREVEKVANEPATDEELNVIKQNVLGNYQMNFEQPWFVASLLQSAHYLEVSEEFMKGYPTRIAAMSPYDALSAAERYLQPRNWWLVVVGKPDIAKELERWGDVYRYDLDLKQIGSAQPESVSMSVAELLRRYTDALGGEQKLRSVQTIVKESSVTLNAGGQQFDGSSTVKQKAPNKLYQRLSLPVVQQEQWVDGTNAWIKQGPQAPQPAPDRIAPEMLDRATMFYVTKLPQLGYQCSIVGKRNGAIVLRATKNGKETRFYFDEKTFLLRRTDYQQGNPDEGGITMSEYYDDYAPVEGIMLPRKERLESPMFSMSSTNTYQLGIPLDDSQFEPPKQ